MRSFVAAILLFLVGEPVGAQVSMSFEAHKTGWGDHPVSGPRPFYAKMNFKAIPKPLDTAVADFELTVCGDGYLNQREVWPIRVAYSSATTVLVSDSVLFWGGEHELRATLAGTIRFVPLTSGMSSIALFWRPAGVELDNFVFLVNGVSFDWCLDDDGVLQYLGCSEGKPPDCTYSGVSFFKSDQVRIRSSRTETERYLFDYEIISETPLVIDDTATVLFTLKALRDFPMGVNISLIGWSCELLSPETNLPQALAEGDSVELRVRFIPRPVRDRHGISMIIEDPSLPEDDSYRQQLIGFGFSFDESGKLRYVGRGQWSAPASALPKSYPWASSAQNNTELIIRASHK